ncbi:MAG: AMP-binding protein [Micromonosporaceae bacterium]
MEPRTSAEHPPASARQPGTFAEYVEARSRDGRTGLMSGEERFTWAQMVAAARVRARLTDAICGTRPAGRSAGEPGRAWHIGILLDNTPEYVFWILAATLSGNVVVGINPTRRGSELAADIRHTDCDMIVTDAEHVGLIDGLDTGISRERILITGQPAYADLLAAAESPAGEVQGPGPTQTLLLLFTSGSTGAPKAVICSQGRLTRIARVSAPLFDITAESVTYAAMPLFHGNSIMANLAPAVATGAAIALRPKFSASGFLPDIRRYGVTYVNYVGRALAYVLATPERPEDADNPLRLAFGTEASARDMAEFGRRFGCRVLENYGSSEGAISIQKAPGTPPSALGLPPEGMDVAICDPGTGRECPRARLSPQGRLLNPGEAIGEIVGRNVASAFEGYYKNQAADEARVRGGWYWSGDLGYRDEAGFFYFAGRDADWLRVDSENFAAAPVERIIARFPDVVMCAVYPVPDPRTGDQVMASVELSPSAAFRPEQFEAFLADQPDLGTKWAPRFVRVVTAMPLTATSKVDKAALRREIWLTSDPVWWRPDRALCYKPLTCEDKARIRSDFGAAGRGHLLPGDV